MLNLIIPININNSMLKKSIYVILFLIAALNMAIAESSLDYDSIPITPKTWKEVDLSYSDTINGKEYPAEIKLLRPITWLKERGIDKVGNIAIFSIPEFGVERVKAKVTDIQPIKLDTSKINLLDQKSRPVIGTFKRYAQVVNTYTFKDLSTGKISTINATPNHPFYVKNKNRFIPIEDIETTDELVSKKKTGKQVRLLCAKGKFDHCGKIYNKDGQPVEVYNLEVYQDHVYFVGVDGVLVHNTCPFQRIQNGNLIHDIYDGNTITTISQSRIDASEFTNRYNSNEWTMMINRREDTAPYYMSDIVEVQARKVLGGDFRAPSSIVREGISNQDTIGAISHLQSGSPEFLDRFMRKTVNGKSTQRIIDLFHGRATRADLFYIDGDPSVRVHIYYPNDMNNLIDLFSKLQI
jgi:hypothetical protein